MSNVTTRFAPSPTGPFHIGGARTALFNYLYAANKGGSMILRIEDTDDERSKKEYEEEIIEGLKWLNISYEQTYRQSERMDIYTRYLEKLLDTDMAYESNEEKDGKKSVVIRFRNPGTSVTFQDMVRGDITFDTKELGDFVIARSRTSPLYHFSVVVDDYEMEITHVIRGEDHISNTARQILLIKAIGASVPKYAHIPLVLSSNRSKLSKRDGVTSILEYKKLGYIPEALVNFLVLLGWSPQAISSEIGEILSPEKLVKHFSLEDVQKGGAIFNEEKLRWINKEYLKRLSSEEFENYIIEQLPNEVKEMPQYSDERFLRLSGIFRERISVFSDIQNLHKEGEFDYIFAVPEYDPANLVWKKGGTEAKTKDNLDKTIETLQKISEVDFTPEKIKEKMWDFAEEKGKGEVLWPVRYALSGKDKSPDPFSLSWIFGKEETIIRLKAGADALKNKHTL